jgi:CBS domain-containing protein
MLSELPVRQVMSPDVLTFTTDENVTDAMALLVERDIDAGPVVGGDGKVVGMLSTGDLVVGEARLHFPTVVNFLGVNVAMPFHHDDLDDSVRKALGASVGDVMTTEVVSVGPDASVEDAATLMHDRKVSRLPVVDEDGQLVGIVSRGDIVRAIVADRG